LLGADGCVVGSETAALALATPLSLAQTVSLVHGARGLAVAAHIDRRSFSVLSQLGFFPADAAFDALELSAHVRADSPALEQAAALALPVTSSSDSHFLEDVGTASTELLLVEPTFAELALAFAGADGRSAHRAIPEGDPRSAADA
jgi:3',5'-nucleoside bisphosphate phosphatase